MKKMYFTILAMLFLAIMASNWNNVPAPATIMLLTLGCIPLLSRRIKKRI